MTSPGVALHPAGGEPAQQMGRAGMRTSAVLAVLLAAILCVVFYSFRNDTLIGDGLRHLPAFRTILPGSPPAFRDKPWLEAYRNHYDELVVHNHFLFALTMRSAFALQQALGSRADAVVAMQSVNSLCAAVAAALLFLLGVRIGLPGWISFVVAVGLSLSPAYLLAATNIAEVALALPFFVGTLLLLTARQLSGPILVLAGILAGFTAIFYAIAGCVVPAIAAALLLTQRPLRSAIKPLVLFLSAFVTVFFGIWVTVLLASGYRSLHSVSHAILEFPQEGTFVQFRASSLIATAVGLTQGFLPVLPNDFVGLRSLYQRPAALAYVSAASLFVCAFLLAVFYVLLKRGMLRTPLGLSCLLGFLFVEAACAKWDTYYQKLHLFAVVLCWVMVLLALSQLPRPAIRWPALLLVCLVTVSGIGLLRKNIEPSQPRANARQLLATVGDGLIITTWNTDIMHANLYANPESMVSLPELGFSSHLDSPEARQKLQSKIQQAAQQGRTVFFYGLFDETTGQPLDSFENRFREQGMTAYLATLQEKARPVARFPQNDGRTLVLYQYVPGATGGQHPLLAAPSHL